MQASEKVAHYALKHKNRTNIYHIREENLYKFFHNVHHVLLSVRRSDCNKYIIATLVALEFDARKFY